ncbi:MAG TPA: hypothetical protein VFH78_10875 [Candidatus Thermoplasmatota archaeon]|nr:hypothetical protein [Candidatus Thermoplasmatota archaeon]
MRALLLLALLLGPVALAGCNAPEDEERPPPRVVSRPPREPPAALRLVSVEATPNESEVGRPVSAVALVANDGPAAAEAIVLFDIVGGANATGTARVAPGETAEVRADLVPTSGGNLSLRARLGEQEDATSLLVRAPRVTGLALAAEPVEPCGAVRVTLSFLNAGDAPARGVRAQLDLLDAAEGPLVSLTLEMGEVAPGERGAASADVAELRAACEGPEPEVYAYRAKVSVEALREAELVGVFRA